MRLLTGLFLLGFGSTAAAQEAVPVAFLDLPGLVAGRNRAVSGAERMVDATRSRVGRLRRSFLPSLGAEAGTESFETGGYAGRTQPYGYLEARFNLYRGGRDRLAEEGLGVRQTAASAAAGGVLAAELAAARGLFWRLVSSREAVKLYEEALRQNGRLLETAKRRISRGLATETDRLEFEINGSQLQEEAERLVQASALLEIRLGAALGLPPGTRLVVPEVVAHEHDEALIAAPFDAAAHPEGRALAALARLSSIESEEARRWWVPSLDAYGGAYLYTLRERDSLRQSERDDRVIGARLTLPLFGGGVSRAEADALRIESEGISLRASQLESVLEAEARAAKLELSNMHGLIHYSEDRIAKGREYFSLTLNEYERGVKNSLDVLGASQRQGSLLRQDAERRRDYQLSKAALLSLLGR